MEQIEFPVKDSHERSCSFERLCAFYDTHTHTHARADYIL